jgi:response regulator RpfG family c-di-GMP phosphodiesterase
MNQPLDQHNQPGHDMQDLPATSGFGPRVIAIVLIILIIFLGWMFFWQFYAERQALYDARRDALRGQVQQVVALCRHYHSLAEEGQMLRTAAIDEATGIIGNLTYGPQHAGYFFIIDTSGEMVMHPLRPDLEGSLMADLESGAQKELIDELIDAARYQGTFITYRGSWLSATEEHNPEFLAYAATFEPWNWIIVTQATTADINNLIFAPLTRQLVVLAMLTLVLAVVIAVVLRKLVLHGIDRLVLVARQIAHGNLRARAVVSPTDELSSLAAAINNMAAGLQSRDEQIRLTQRTAVFALAKLAEQRDNETGDHLLRVREYAVLLAEALSSEPEWREIITPQFLDDLYDASLLHDIGKVAIPDSILLKPDSLSDGEMAIMMSHTLVGANTIRAARKQMRAESSFLKMAEQIARSHHERWDGTGYVEYLKGRSIPPAARIFAIADVYDALTTERPYKQAYSHKDAVATMAEDRGKRFDPVVFDAFLRNAGRFKDIRDRLAAAG